MAKYVTLSIDVTKIDKAKIISGKKGKYINAMVWINDKEDQYGYTASIQQGGSKEDRDGGYKGPYLGNGKHYGIAEADSFSSKEDSNEDLPF